MAVCGPHRFPWHKCQSPQRILGLCHNTMVLVGALLVHGTSLMPGQGRCLAAEGALGGDRLALSQNQGGNGPRLVQGEEGRRKSTEKLNRFLPPSVHTVPARAGLPNTARGPGLPATCCEQSFIGTQPHPSCTHLPWLRGPQSNVSAISSSQTVSGHWRAARLGCIQEAPGPSPTSEDPAPGSGTGPCIQQT